MKEIELIGKRKPREKHFLKKNGIIEAQVFDEDIHFLKDGSYEEIDNTLIDIGDYYTNKNNAYNVKFAKTSIEELTDISIGNNYIKTKLVNCNVSQLVENINESKLHKNVCYPNILDNIDLEYNIMPAKVKEAIILKNKEVDLDKLVFSIETNMRLELLDKKIVAKTDDKVCFEFDAPYMIDSNFKTNNNISYELSRTEDGKYLLKLNVDRKWLSSDETKYPVMIDPTITNSNQDNSVYDTYIYPGDTDVDRNSQDILKVGVERVNGVDRINRSLIKFELPTIGTGSQVVEAAIDIYGYPQAPATSESDMITIHQITSSWNEADANWNMMNDKYNPMVEGIMEANRGYYDYQNGTIVPAYCGANITRLVRKWYTGTPNNGLMLKQNEEKYNPDILPVFYSKNNKVVGGNPKPIIFIAYRNQNGLEDYMDYEVQKFCKGTAYVNSYNGNLTSIFNIGSTFGGKMPVSLNLVYNTNDVVLNNNIGYGCGYRLNLHQTIKEQVIDGTTYLEYTDEDGTLHYFLNQQTSFDDNGYTTEETGNIYHDEDGLNITITKNDGYYILKDKNGNTMKFIKDGDIAYLSEIEDLNGNKNIISYNSDKMISKIVDANGAEINIMEADSRIIIFSPSRTVRLIYDNGRIVNIIDLDGTTSFEYNENDLISKIIDINELKISYDYYSQIPYKIKKVCEYGSENTMGNYYELIYGFDSTTIINSKGRAKTNIYNSQGGIVSVSSMKSNDDVENAYGISQINGTNDGTNPGYNNKLLRSEVPIKYVKNFLSNTSFEGSEIKFVGTDDISISVSNEDSLTGLNSLKTISTSENQTISQTINVKKDNYYTFSAYVKNTNNIRLILSYLDENNTLVSRESELISANDDFDRYDVTIYYPENATSELSLIINFETPGITYIDDIQLELGEVANNYNMLENSDFSDGFDDWNLSIWGDEESSARDYFSVVNINDNVKALKIKTNPICGINMEKTFNINGKAGDVFNISFWYKNEGIDSNLSMYYGSRIDIGFHYIDEENGHCGIIAPKLNPNDAAWQYVSNDFVAEEDYNAITVSFSREYDANDLYITNLNLFKDIRNIYYEYDENGNVILENNMDNSSTEFSYDKNNQLIQMLDSKNKKFTYEYDNVITNRIINGISESGISNHIKYDANENPILTKIISDNILGDISDGLYKIRLKGTNKYLRNIENQIKTIEEDCSHDLWLLQKEEEYFKIHHSIIIDKYFTVQNNSLLLTSIDGDNSLFSLVKNKNGSYLIKLKSEDKYLKYNDSGLELANLEEDDYHYEFYFEIDNNDLFMENSAEYTEDGRFIKNVINTLSSKTIYDIDPETGLTRSVIDAKGNTYKYDYNENKLLKSLSFIDKKVNYEYNAKNQLKEIIQGNRKYILNYDEFSNIKEMKIGNDITLVTNIYEDNNGNLSSVRYGNNNVVSYKYDCFDRLEQKIAMNDVYKYKYGNNGDLIKIQSNEYDVKFTYALSKKLSEYKFNNFIVKYKYDTDNNIINKKLKFDTDKKFINYIYNEDNLITKITYDDNINLNYSYDSLGRVTNSNIDGGMNVNYKYITNGKKTSVVIDSIIFEDDKYSYRYDESSNITHIYHNGILEKKYYYDGYNELIEENDFLNNQTIKYKYDEYGNILSKITYELNSYNLIHKNKYQYNNLKWVDLLTKFNDDIITYDGIGNPLTIGDNIQLSWIDGRKLNSYNDINNSINYKYDHNGRRISKIVNSLETKYYLEGSKIIYEISGNNKLYYLYDGNNLIGFEFNDVIYYYQKNLQEDIVGIFDADKNLIAKYVYDVWGNILSITDENENDISNISEHVANINPFRYRSYYYDSETKLYYLNNRYYNPTWGRFINADGGIGINKDILTYNLFAYCSNNPVNNSDYNGKGIFKSIISKVGKAVKKVMKTVSKVVSAISSAAKTLSSAVSTVSHAIVGNHYYKSYGTNSNLSQTVQKSPVMQNEINNKISEFEKSGETSHLYVDSVGFYHSKNIYDFSLSMAIGRAKYEMSITKETRVDAGITYYRYKVDTTLKDCYDFDNFRWDLSPTSIANDFGCIMQEVNVFREYYYDVQLETVYTKWEADI